MDREYKYIYHLSRYFSNQGQKLILGPGDDCAVLKVGKRYLALTVDEMIENTHFLYSFSSPTLLASKLVRASVSDIYSMGNCQPLTCLVSAGLRNDLDELWFWSFIKALKKECKLFDLTLAGGNMAKAKELHLTMTVIGNFKNKKIIRRKGAKAGELIYAVGKMGNAKAGLEILLNKKVKYSELEKKFIRSFWKPQIFKKEAAIISNFATSMLDNSDGLYRSLEILSFENNIKIVADINENFADKSLIIWACKEGKNWREYILSGGEDYNLIFTIKASDKAKLEERLPYAYQIGYIEKGSGIVIKNYNEKIKPFEHF